MVDLLREVQKRREQLPSLQKRRARLATDLEKLDREIAALTGSSNLGKVPPRGRGVAKAPRRKRAKNKISLVDAIVHVMKQSSGPTTAAEAVAGVKKAGYKTQSANFRALVSQTLSKNKPPFKSVKLGKYVLAQK